MVLLGGQVSADLEFNIRDSCEGDEEAIFSMHQKQDSNIGMPGYFKYQVCAEGIEYSEIRNSCNSDENSVISMFQRNDSHVSINQEYNWDVCIPQVKTNLSQSCSNPIVSMHSDFDSHVAEPGYYSNQLCASFEEPENVTVGLELSSKEDVYVDGSSAEKRSYTPIELAYPYISTDQPLGLVSYGSIEQIEYSENPNSVLELTQSANSVSVLIPYTSGGYTEIEDDETDVTDRTFLDRYSASFSDTGDSVPVLKVRKKFQHDVDGFEDTESGSVKVSVRNKINNNDSVKILLNSIG